MADAKQKKELMGKIAKLFKCGGVLLQGADAASHLSDYLLRHGLTGESESDALLQEFMKKLFTQLTEMGAESATKDSLKLAIESIEGAQGAEVAEHRMFVISAYDMPVTSYNPDRDVFTQVEKEAAASSIIAPASSLVSMMRTRMAIASGRTKRISSGQGRAAFSSATSREAELTHISSLSGIPSTEERIILGLIRRSPLENNQLLIDDGDAIPLNLSEMQGQIEGLFTEACFVLAKGRSVEGEFRATTVGFPPTERRVDSIKRLPHNLDFFGRRSDEGTEQMLLSSESKIVILSEFHLDYAPNLYRLDQIMKSFEEQGDCHNYWIFLVGSFCSQEFSYGDVPACACPNYASVKAYTAGFDALAEVLGRHGTMAAKAHFTFVPGPNDPTFGGTTFPQSPIPEVFTRSVRGLLANVNFSTNPCRLRAFTREMVIFRDDLYSKMRRICLPGFEPSDKPGTPHYDHFVRTIAHQAHLSPVPLSVNPVEWAYDHALRLFPLPDFVILCDTGENWDLEFEGTRFTNPGSFSAHRSLLIYETKNLDPESAESAVKQLN